MPMIERLNGASAPLFSDRMAAAANTVPVPRNLLRALQAASISTPADDGRLSEEQLIKLLEGKQIGDRIALKGQIMAAGLYPRDMATFSPMPNGR